MQIGRGEYPSIVVGNQVPMVKRRSRRGVRSTSVIALAIPPPLGEMWLGAGVVGAGLNGYPYSILSRTIERNRRHDSA